MMRIRPARPDDLPALLALWERSVRASHDFLGEDDVVGLRPQVAEALALPSVGWWVLTVDPDTPAGFLGFADGAIEALFIDPEHFGAGGGRRLVAHAQTLAGERALTVEVNEQNRGAVAFYAALGFVAFDRTPVDSAGRPFPLLRMRRAAPGAPPGR